MVEITPMVVRGYKLNADEFRQIPREVREEMRDADVMFVMDAYNPMESEYVIGEAVIQGSLGRATRLSPIKDFNFGEMDTRIKADYYRAFGKMPTKEPHFYMGIMLW